MSTRLPGLRGERCGHDMEPRNLNRGRTEPVCARPDAHPGLRHMSLTAYRHMLARRRAYREANGA